LSKVHAPGKACLAIGGSRYIVLNESFPNMNADLRSRTILIAREIYELYGLHYGTHSQARNAVQ